MVKVKICGITNISDAIASVNSGCDALGFVFYKKSPRYITPQKASYIIRHMPKNIIKIGVFVNSGEKRIKEIAKLCKMDILQFHGEESSGFCQKFKNYKIIKAFRIKDRIDWQNILRYKSFAYLFDTFAKSKIGGTGKRFNWDILRHVKNIKHPIFLSGGLNSRNVRRAIEKLHPDWVDVSTSIESHPGKKDHHKVKKFIQAAKGNG
jgi:phosphoribosylanthranilate isomerase